MTNAIKVLLQMQSGFLQLASTLYEYICNDIVCDINLEIMIGYR
jgi:hypothetical protein